MRSLVVALVVTPVVSRMLPVMQENGRELKTAGIRRHPPDSKTPRPRDYGSAASRQ